MKINENLNSVNSFTKTVDKGYVFKSSNNDIIVKNNNPSVVNKMNIRLDKVEEMKNKIKSGTLKVSPENIVDKLLQTKDLTLN